MNTQQEQVARVIENLRRKPDDLERYIFLSALQDRNEQLFYRVALDHLETMLPILYTPTVGLACQQYGHIFQRPRGLFVSARSKGRVGELLDNWPQKDVRVIVVTDGERILGLGDLGANGMGIPVGKLCLYTACAGVHPGECLPVMLDVGTDNDALRDDPLYIGLKRRRMRGQEYDDLFAEFIEAVTERHPKAVVQLEDFGTANAFRLLGEYRDRLCLFDDDIQGTGAVALAGLYSALRMTGGRLRDMTVLLAGAGEAGTGIADAVTAALADDGLSAEEARRRVWLFDSRGLVTARRDELEPHKRPYAHPGESLRTLEEAVSALTPDAIIGASGTPGLFGRALLQSMCELKQRPIVFALSNPTSRAECTAEQAYRWTRRRAIFASGSPFAPVDLDGLHLVPGQCNNAYIFPGVGLGLVASGAKRVTDGMFLRAAKALAGLVSTDDLSCGRIYPPIARLREVSLEVAVAVADEAFERGLASVPAPADLRAAIRARLYEPSYANYLDGAPSRSSRPTA